jgi:hypothetical protein
MNCARCHHPETAHRTRCTWAISFNNRLGRDRICSCRVFVVPEPWESEGTVFQLCLRCGRHEVAGAYCTFCRTAEYDVADHRHPQGSGNACPLGPYLDPLDGDAKHIRGFVAKPKPNLVAGVTIRHHPRSPGTDPEVPPWIAHRQAVVALEQR